MNDKAKLTPEDQARVDQFISSGYNSTERKPFRPLVLLLILVIVVVILGRIALGYASYHGLI